MCDSVDCFRLPFETMDSCSFSARICLHWGLKLNKQRMILCVYFLLASLHGRVAVLMPAVSYHDLTHLFIFANFSFLCVRMLQVVTYKAASVFSSRDVDSCLFFFGSRYIAAPHGRLPMRRFTLLVTMHVHANM